MLNRLTTLVICALLSMLILACHRTQTQTPSPVAQVSPTPPNLKPIAVPSPIIGKPYPGTGIVKFINQKEGWIEIDHEEIVGLMPPMVMEWHVQKRSHLNRVKVGDKVNFIVVETGRGEIITELQKATVAH